MENRANVKNVCGIRLLFKLFPIEEWMRVMAAKSVFAGSHGNSA